MEKRKSVFLVSFSTALIVSLILILRTRRVPIQTLSFELTSVTDYRVEIILVASNNSAMRLAKVDHQYQDNTLTLQFSESLIGSHAYPYRFVLIEDFSTLTTIALIDGKNRKVIYQR